MLYWCGTSSFQVGIISLFFLQIVFIQTSPVIEEVNLLREVEFLFWNIVKRLMKISVIKIKIRKIRITKIWFESRIPAETLMKNSHSRVFQTECLMWCYLQLQEQRNPPNIACISTCQISVILKLAGNEIRHSIFKKLLKSRKWDINWSCSK